jgi:hypothetical protein
MAERSRTLEQLLIVMDHCCWTKLKVMFPPDMVAFWNMFIANSGFHRNVKSLDSYIEASSDSDRRRISSALQNLGQNDESPLTSVTSVPSSTDYTHDVSFGSAQEKEGAAGR